MKTVYWYRNGSLLKYNFFYWVSVLDAKPASIEYLGIGIGKSLVWIFLCLQGIPPSQTLSEGAREDFNIQLSCHLHVTIQNKSFIRSIRLLLQLIAQELITNLSLSFCIPWMNKKRENFTYDNVSAKIRVFKLKVINHNCT